jgi:DNA repair exonuclease SbcCD ATPase subunit
MLCLRSRTRRLLAASLARLTQAALVALLAHASPALAQTDPLELKALVQEGDLILEEAATLAPANEKLTKEGLQIAASDKALRAEIQALEDGIKRFNASMEQLNVGAKQHQAQCPQRIEDPAQLESCNARAAELAELARKLDERRPALEARRKELNTQVDQHNQASKDFAQRKQEYDSRDMLNQHDAEDWLGRARAFLASETFNTFLAQARSPAACGSDRLAELATLPALKAVTRAQDCLKAVKAATT